jgi:hypothetical protein
MSKALQTYILYGSIKAFVYIYHPFEKLLYIQRYFVMAKSLLYVLNLLSKKYY